MLYKFGISYNITSTYSIEKETWFTVPPVLFQGIDGVCFGLGSSHNTTNEFQYTCNKKTIQTDLSFSSKSNVNFAFCIVMNKYIYLLRKNTDFFKEKLDFIVYDNKNHR